MCKFEVIFFLLKIKTSIFLFLVFYFFVNIHRSQDICVRDSETLLSLVREANVSKVQLRVVRFFGNGSGNECTSSAENVKSVSPRQKHLSHAKQIRNKKLQTTFLLPSLDMPALAKRLAFLPNVSVALKGKRIHHKWSERAGLHRGQSTNDMPKPQATHLQDFPTQTLFAIKIGGEDQNLKNTWPEDVKGNSVDHVLMALHPVKGRLLEHLVFRAAQFSGSISVDVTDGSILIAIGPVNVIGYPLHQIKCLLETVVCHHSLFCVLILI